MSYVETLAFVVFAFFLGFIARENDMANNCARDGNAHAWFNEIKCEKSK